MLQEAPEVTAEAESAGGDPPAAPLACIDLDRFCGGCGYNLRTQPVARDPGTGIPLVRCPECGRHESANETATALRPWLRRTTGLLLGIWVFVVIGVFGLMWLGEGGLSYSTLDELTVYGGFRIQRINAATVRTWGGTGTVEIREGYPQYGMFVALVLTCSYLLAYLCGLWAVVILPHWRRAAYLGLVLVTPLLIFGIVAVAWNQEAPHLLYWGLIHLGAHAGAQVAGGVTGVLMGRPVARLALRVLLPPSLRPRLAYLWMVDGKPLPQSQ
ncbi:MAG: hypothetical protein GY778_25155 [bacterium]|nr:hypothetical protein [bacterium]